MSVLSAPLPSVVKEHLPKGFSKTKEQELSPETEYGPIHVVDDILRSRAAEKNQVPLIAYPQSETGLTDFAHYTARDLDGFADSGAKTYMAKGLEPVHDAPVVAILGPSNLEYLITVFSLTRLGYAVLFLSNRLALNAYLALIEKTDCKGIIYSPAFATVSSDLQSAQPSLRTWPMLTRASFLSPDPTITNAPPFKHTLDRTAHASRIAFIIHSSGSTGVPKPIFQSHSSCINNYSQSFDQRPAAITSPLYHNFGLCNTYRSVWKRREIFFYNANLPLTGANLTALMQEAKPGILFAVPYTLKLLGESDAGVEALRRCEVVLFGGSACPDELGDRLVEAGVNLVGHYGSTEVGQLMTSQRPPSDTAWNYLRLLPPTRDFILMDPLGANTYECVVLDGWPSKVVNNATTPPNSFRTRDTFIPHPTLPHAWKHVGRLDDRVTLMNGEKVLPLPLEGAVRERPLVREAVVFGVGRAVPGLLLFRSPAAASLSDAAFLDAVWPTVQAANARAEQFGRIARDMLVPLPADAAFPQTDKGTFIRARVYADFSAAIDAAYAAVEDAAGEGTLALPQPALEDWLLALFARHDVALAGPEADFFAAGVDSRQAITVWGLLRRELDLGGHGSQMSQNVVFETGCVRALAAFLVRLHAGEGSEGEDEQEREIRDMEMLIEKYGSFERVAPESPAPYPEKHTVILTGATGSLGAHLLAQLLPQPNIAHIYLPVRASSDTAAQSRILTSLDTRALLTPSLTSLLETKTTALAADLSQPTLGLPPATLTALRTSTTLVIHSAWAVNFNLPVRTFDPTIASLSHLLHLTLTSPLPSPPALLFASSISSASGTPAPASIPEAPVPLLAHAQNMGYARSKLVGERLVARAATAGANARTLRIGQIVGDGVAGVWNDSEAIPLLVRSARVLGVLPALPDKCSWFPVDGLARTVLELAGVRGEGEEDAVSPGELLARNAGAADPALVYNVLNPVRFSWTDDFLPALRACAGFPAFRTVPVAEWLAALAGSERDGGKNPSIKLLGFWQGKYGGESEGLGALEFETESTRERSWTMRERAPRIVEEGYVQRFVGWWLGRWVEGEKEGKE